MPTRILSVAEKPSVAKGISQILSSGRFQSVRARDKQRYRAIAERISLSLILQHTSWGSSGYIGLGHIPGHLPWAERRRDEIQPELRVHVQCAGGNKLSNDRYLRIRPPYAD